MTIYLYVKTHNKTGLKYLGKTTKDPHTYLGSGVDWKLHLKEHGEEHSTEIIRECQSNQELNEWGRYYSNLWNVADSLEWANRIPETGGGGNHTEERKELFRQQQLGRKKPPRTDEHKKKLGDSLRNRIRPELSAKLTGRKLSDTHIKNTSAGVKKWYQSNPQLSHQKALKTWDGIYKKNYEKYKIAVSFIAEGKTNREITKLMKIDSATINKLRTKSHRVFELFPEFKQLMSTEVL
jgi:hypothetical protein